MAIVIEPLPVDPPVGGAPPLRADALEPELVDALVALRRAADADRDPGDPPVGADVVVPELLLVPPRKVQRAWLAHDGDQVVATLIARTRVAGENAGKAELEVEVHPGRRGDGLVPRLVAAAVPWMRDAGTSDVTWWTDDADRPVAESMGLTFRQQERLSRMVVAEVDDAQQAAWIEAPRARAAGYQVLTWAGPCPPEHLDAYAAAFSAMADAPTDGVDINPQAVMPADVVELDAHVVAGGGRTFSALALDRDGRAAGMTAIQVHPGWSWFGAQEDTAVVREHRGVALGRWLKAANLAQVRSAHPEMAVIETYNAESNPWMLAINVDMGFRPHRSYFAHQAPIDGLRGVT